MIEKSKFISLLNHDASTSLKNQHFLFHVDRNSFFLDQYRCLQKMVLTWTFSYYTIVQTSIHITDISLDVRIKDGIWIFDFYLHSKIYACLKVVELNGIAISFFHHNRHSLPFDLEFFVSLIIPNDRRCLWQERFLTIGGVKVPPKVWFAGSRM